MKSVLSQDDVRALFDYDPAGQLLWKVDRGTNKTKGRAAGWLDQHGYTRVSLNQEKFGLHRLIFLWHHGYLPLTVDHIDRNPGNNRIENLREATLAEQARNCKAHTGRGDSSQWKGVSYHAKKRNWRAYVQADGKPTYLGSFAAEADAALAYNFAAAEAHGAFAVLNEAVQTCPLAV